MDYKYTGIILNKRNIGETDRIYTIYTQEAGKIRVLGKGVRKPNAKLAGSLESITLAEIFIAKTRGMGKITGAIVAENFLQLKSNLEALNRVNQIFRMFERLIVEQEQDKEIFKIILGFVKSLDKLSAEAGNENKMDVLMMGFIFKLLSETGYRLEVEKCVNCEQKLRPENNYFSAGKGGVLCSNCYKRENKRINPHTKNLEFSDHGYTYSNVKRENFGVGVKISSESIKLIRIFLKNKIENLAKLQVATKDVNNLRVIAQESINWL